MAIDLNFNEQQQLIRDTARQFFEQHCPPALVRKHHGAEDEFPRQLWRQMAELGWLGMSFPEDLGGLACSFLDTYALYLELGRSLAPTPHLDTVELGGALVAALGDERQKRELLPAVAEGRLILSPALMEPGGVYGPEGIGLAARKEGSSYLLKGVKALVPNVGTAGRLICAARSGPGRGGAGVTLFLVDPRAPGVTAQRTPNIAGLPLYAVTFSNVAVAPEDVLGPVEQAWPTLYETMMRAAVLQSAMVVGAGERILEMTVNYANTRVQFGEPIGKHQAVQYLVTDLAMHGHHTGLLALQAAWRIDTGQPFIREAAFAKAAASRAAAAMTFASHEVHAGIGFMADYDLQLFTRRGKHWEFNLGDHRHHLEQAMAHPAQ